MLLSRFRQKSQSQYVRAYFMKVNSYNCEINNRKHHTGHSVGVKEVLWLYMTEIDHYFQLWHRVGWDTLHNLTVFQTAVPGINRIKGRLKKIKWSPSFTAFNFKNVFAVLSKDYNHLRWWWWRLSLLSCALIKKRERDGDRELNPVIQKPVDFLISNGQNQTEISNNV